jgi:hypothetical protein
MALVDSDDWVDVVDLGLGLFYCSLTTRRLDIDHFPNATNVDVDRFPGRSLDVQGE